MSDKNINKIILHSKGDESVGLFSATWSIDGPIFIDTDDVDEFAKKLTEAFGLVAEDVSVRFEYEGKCSECGNPGAVIQPPDPYEGWCMSCARNDAMADSDAYDYRTRQIEGDGW